MVSEHSCLELEVEALWGIIRQASTLHSLASLHCVLSLCRALVPEFLKPRAASGTGSMRTCAVSYCVLGPRGCSSSRVPPYATNLAACKGRSSGSRSVVPHCSSAHVSETGSNRRGKNGKTGNCVSCTGRPRRPSSASARLSRGGVRRTACGM